MEPVAAEVDPDPRDLVARGGPAEASRPLQEGDRVSGARGAVGRADAGGSASQDEEATVPGAQAQTGTAAGIAPAG